MILDAYAAFLTALSVPFFTTNGFAVEIQGIMIDVTVTRSGMITLSSYIDVCTDLAAAENLSSALSARFRGYKIWPEKYSGYYEVEIESFFPYSDIPSLHERVVAMADVVETQRIKYFLYIYWRFKTERMYKSPSTDMILLDGNGN